MVNILIRMKDFLEKHAVGLFGFLCFFPPLIVALNYGLNHFFVTGCYMYDSGLLGYLSTHSLTWPMPALPFLPYRTFFATHLILIFYLLSFIRDILATIGLEIHNSVFFSYTMGLWLGITAVGTYALLVGKIEKQSLRFYFFAFVIAVGAGLNGISIASMGLPHFELAVPAFLICFFACFVNGKKWLSYLFLFLGLITREDVGLHYFIFLFILTLYLYNSKKIKNSESYAFYFGTLSSICLLTSVLLFSYQKVFYGGHSVAHNVYFGDPAFEHLTSELMIERFWIIVQYRHYILFPIAALLIVALLRKSILMALGFFAIVPWTIFSVIGVVSNPGNLTSYYTFPIVVTFVWPIISYRLELFWGLRTEESYFQRIVFPGIVVFLSIIGTHKMGYLHDDDPWPFFGFKWWGRVTTNLNSVDRFLDANESRIKFAADDAFTCMRNDKVPLKPWIWATNLGAQTIKTDVDTLIYLPDSRLQYNLVRNLLREGKFKYYCNIEGSMFMVATNVAGLKYCTPRYSPNPKDLEIP